MWVILGCPYDERMNDCASLNDLDLLRLLQQSDPTAFQELYTRYWSKLYFLAHKRLKSATAAEEIVQNVFLILWRKRKTLRIEDPAAYLAAVTRYAVYHYVAAEKRRAEKEGVAGSGSLRVVPGEMLIDDKQLLEIVKQQANELPEKCRLVFIYNKLEDQTLPDVAERLNISVKTAEAHLTKALRLIRSKLRDSALFIFF
jgi:RNA polymerase sigma factor (sigma-70 family)